MPRKGHYTSFDKLGTRKQKATNPKTLNELLYLKQKASEIADVEARRKETKRINALRSRIIRKQRMENDFNEIKHAKSVMQKFFEVNQEMISITTKIVKLVESFLPKLSAQEIANFEIEREKLGDVFQELAVISDESLRLTEYHDNIVKNMNDNFMSIQTNAMTNEVDDTEIFDDKKLLEEIAREFAMFVEENEANFGG